MTTKKTLYAERLAALRLGISRTTLRAHRKRGTIEATVVGGSIVIYTEGAIKKWLAEYGRNVRRRQICQPRFAVV